MHKHLVLAFGLLIIPGLYAMDEDAQFKQEQETKAAHYAEEALTIRDLRPADERWQQWLAEDQNSEKHAQKLKRLTCTQQTDVILSRDCKTSLATAASLPTAVQEHIWSFATDSKKRYIGNQMEQLIPAVIDWVEKVRPIFDCIEHAKTKKLTLDTVNQKRIDRALSPLALPDNKLYYIGKLYWAGFHKTYYKWSYIPIISCPAHEGVDDSIDLIPSSERESLQFFGTNNQFNVLYYANGSTVFKVHDSKRAELEKLSAKQLEYITNLYHTRARNLAEQNTAEIHLTPKQIRLHKSLPTSMRVNLQNVYDLVEIKQERAAANRRKQCCTRLAFASLAAALSFQHLIGR